MQWLAIECPGRKSRMSINTYLTLMDKVSILASLFYCHSCMNCRTPKQNDGEDWQWVTRHTAESWREQYKRCQTYYDTWIAQYQQDWNIDPNGGRRPDMWKIVPSPRRTTTKRRTVENNPVNLGIPKKAKQPATGSSGSQARAKPTSSQSKTSASKPRPVLKKKVVQSDSEPEPELEPTTPQPSQRAKGKQRAIREEEEEEEEESAAPADEDDVLPVLRPRHHSPEIPVGEQDVWDPPEQQETLVQHQEATELPEDNGTQSETTKERLPESPAALHRKNVSHPVPSLQPSKSPGNSANRAVDATEPGSNDGVAAAHSSTSTDDAEVAEALLSQIEPDEEGEEVDELLLDDMQYVLINRPL